MAEMLGGAERIASNEVDGTVPLSKEDQRARDSVAIAMRIVGPPDAASVRSLE
jgi:hypothetical protein